MRFRAAGDYERRRLDVTASATPKSAKLQSRGRLPVAPRLPETRRADLPPQCARSDGATCSRSGRTSSIEAIGISKGSRRPVSLHIDAHWEFRSSREFHTGVNFTTEGLKEPFDIVPGVTIEPGTYDHEELQLVYRATVRAAATSSCARSSAAASAATA
jgi:hypothetical protein